MWLGRVSLEKLRSIYRGSQTCYGPLHQVLQFHRGSDTRHACIFRLDGLESEIGRAVNVKRWLGPAICFQVVIHFRRIFHDLGGEFQDSRCIFHF